MGKKLAICVNITSALRHHVSTLSCVNIALSCVSTLSCALTMVCVHIIMCPHYGVCPHYHVSTLCYDLCPHYGVTHHIMRFIHISFLFTHISIYLHSYLLIYLYIFNLYYSYISESHHVTSCDLFIGVK